ncbi:MULTISPECIES: hypothetical protein [Arthrobacter]|uniref:Uncharacterized protein n=2 Tax=Arthrobacter TaxID=1663 RepID=A0ABU9KLV5_9MICC|nr:hypothetical protein [Arthrobacter sp. YJM1]MDP5228184.1 hypothetical protein [Arthrobacter sp. YJM1]
MTSAPAGPGLPGTTPRKPSAARQILWLMLLVVTGVPLLLGAWIGLVLLGEDRGWGQSANQVFAWEIAAMMALVLWPLAIRGSHRQFWHNRGRRPHEVAEWGSEPTAPVPKVPLRPGQWIGRATVVVLGGAGILAVSGPQEVTLLILRALGVESIGPDSVWGALQLVTVLLLMGLLLPVMALTERSVRRHPKGSQERFRLEVQQHWYLAAVTAWVISVAMGLMFSALILAYL